MRNFVRVGQRVVLRVLRVDPVKGHIDLSLRRVNSAQKENRMKEWKYALKYENLLQFLAESTDLTLDDAYEKIGFPVLDKFRTYQETIEELKENGEDLLKNIKTISEDVKNKFLGIVNENVNISTVEIVGKIKLTFNAENGVELIKKSLLDAKKIIGNPKETRNLNISYICLYRSQEDGFCHLHILVSSYIAKDWLEKTMKSINLGYPFIYVVITFSSKPSRGKHF